MLNQKENLSVNGLRIRECLKSIGNLRLDSVDKQTFLKVREAQLLLRESLVDIENKLMEF